MSTGIRGNFSTYKLHALGVSILSLKTTALVPKKQSFMQNSQSLLNSFNIPLSIPDTMSLKVKETFYA